MDTLRNIVLLQTSAVGGLLSRGC